MCSTTLDDLYFRAAGSDNKPFDFQRRFAEDDDLPGLVNVPTGCGKTAMAILGWLWRRRFADRTTRDSTPRRLVYCLPMRVLVEQTVTATRDWLDALGLLADGPGDANRVAVWQLMGGEVEMDWDQWPDADAVLIGTQDQLLSRALNRGYAVSRYRWPVHFGLLISDCLWLMDEVQLRGAGLATTAQLQAFREQACSTQYWYLVSKYAKLGLEGVAQVSVSRLRGTRPTADTLTAEDREELYDDDS